MALFSKTKTKKTPATAVAPITAPSIGSAKEVLRAPRITEKAGLMQTKGVYVFNISTDATKRDIIAAVKKMYKVTPRAVRMVNVPEKSVRHMKSGRYGVKGGGKKAYVYLKQGDSITLA
jgi:large subunit ribosomal protein L23